MQPNFELPAATFGFRNQGDACFDCVANRFLQVHVFPGTHGLKSRNGVPVIELEAARCGYNRKNGNTVYVRQLICGKVISTLYGCLIFVILPGSCPLIFAQPAPTSAKAITFEVNVLPILKANCVPCHGATVKMKELDLSTFAATMKGSEAGTVVTAGAPQQSRLYEMVQKGAMPKGGKPLSSDQIAILREWIEAGALSRSQTAESTAAPITEDDVLPIVLLRCTPCHGPRRREGGLDLHTRAAMLKGGKSGPALVPGKPVESLLVKTLRSGEMPPKQGLDDISTKRITPPEIDRLVNWIAQGAAEGRPPDALGVGPDPLVSDKDRQFWAFQPPSGRRFPR